MKERFCQELEKYISAEHILKQEPMSAHTSFQTGGPAELFVSPTSEKEVQAALSLAKEEEIPFFVMGNGSNLLVSDEGFRGMILQIGKNMQQITVEGTELHVQAGALLSRIAKAALEHGLTGFEFAGGIPGSLGGAVAMNAGAYGGEMKDVLTEVTVLTPEGESCTLRAEEMELSYRHSCVFDRQYVVLSARIRLQQGDREQIKARMDVLSQARREKQPLEYPSAGSTFKRPEGYFAGKLIQDTGLKGYTVGGAQVSEKHSGFVINRGGAESCEILFLIRQVQKKVQKKFGVFLETEVRLIGFEE